MPATSMNNNSSVKAEITVNAPGATAGDAKVIGGEIEKVVRKIMSDNNATALKNLSGVVAQ